jgi:hypothetical protein
MITSHINTISYVVIFLLVGGYVIFRVRKNMRKITNNPSYRTVLNDHQLYKRMLEDVIQGYKQEALHYRIFNWRNRKKISLKAQDALFSKYPKIISEPLLILPDELVQNPDVVSDWLTRKGKTVSEYEYIGRVLADYLLAEADREAEMIVQQFVDAANQA